MTFKFTQLGLIASYCLFSFQLSAQTMISKNVAVPSIGVSQNETSLKFRTLSEALAKSPKPWEKNAFSEMSRNEALKSLYRTTIEGLRSPDREHRSKSLGGMDGGGGKALVCLEPNGEFKVKLLDLHDAETLNVDLDFGPGQTFTEKLDYVLNRFAKISPIRAFVYRAMLYDLFTTETQWVQNTVMPPIDDTRLALIPKNCYPIQVAIQRPVDQDHIPNAKPYIIDKDVFPLLDEDSKTMLGLHEVMYREARFSNKSDSVFTRHLVGLISSRQITQMTYEKYNKLLLKNNVTCIESQSLRALVTNDTATRSNSYPPCGYVKSNYLRPSHGEVIQIPLSFDSIYTRAPKEVLNLQVTGILGLPIEGPGLNELNYVFSGTAEPVIKTKSSTEETHFLPKIEMQNGFIGLVMTSGNSYRSYEFSNAGNLLFSDAKPIIYFLGLDIKIDHPYLKAQIKNRAESFVPYDINSLSSENAQTIQIEANCITGDLNAYVGNRPQVATQMGWLKVETACFKGKQLSRVFFKNPNSKKNDSQELDLL